MDMSQCVKRGALAIVDFARRDSKYEILLREVLENERERREFYERLYLTKSGAFGSDSEKLDISTLDDTLYPTIKRHATLTQIRQEAERIYSNKARLAKDSEKTEGEKLFEESLEKVN